jgi:acetate kinase
MGFQEKALPGMLVDCCAAVKWAAQATLLGSAPPSSIHLTQGLHSNPMSRLVKPAAVILSVNIGSSSLKFSAHPVVALSGERTALASILSGTVEGLEPGGTVSVNWISNGHRQTDSLHQPKHQTPIQSALSFLKQLIQDELSDIQILAVAHRVVHGGDRFTKSLIVNQEVIEALRIYAPLAPLHQHHNLDGIVSFMAAFPDQPHVACFDTAFHSSLPAVEKTLPFNQALLQQGIHRYGFHGLSYQYISSRLARLTPAAKGKMLMAHLGNGASLCGCINGKSVVTTMGFSTLGGLMMGTRSGDVDPGVLLHLIQHGMDVHSLESLLYKESGLRGISGISADMRQLRQTDSEQARLAIALYTRRIIKESGALAAAMNGIDVMAFAGGIGENDPTLREDVCNSLAFLGVQIDIEKNRGVTGRHPAAIHAENSRVEVWVVPTGEGLIAAEEALGLLPH